MSNRKKGPADFQSDPVEQERADWDNMDFRQTIAHHHRKMWTKHAKSHTEIQYPDFEHMDDQAILNLVEQAQRKEMMNTYGRIVGHFDVAKNCYCQGDPQLPYEIALTASLKEAGKRFTTSR